MKNISLGFIGDANTLRLHQDLAEELIFVRFTLYPIQDILQPIKFLLNL